MLVPTLGLFTTTQEGVQVGVGVGGGAITRLMVEEAEAVIFAVPTSVSYPVAVKYRPSLDKVINPSPVAVPLASASPTRAIKLSGADERNPFPAEVFISGFSLRY